MGSCLTQEEIRLGTHMLMYSNPRAGILTNKKHISIANFFFSNKF